MALVSCPECGKEISDKAEVCIHCGYNIQFYSNKIKEQEKAKLKEAARLENLRKTEEQKNKEFERRLSKMAVPEGKPILNGWMFAFLGCLAMTILSVHILVIDDGYEFWFFLIFFGLLSWFCFIVAKNHLKIDRERFDKYADNPDEYKRILLKEQMHNEEMGKALKEANESKKSKKNYSPTDSHGNVKCPKCGSTQIQVVNKKYSMVTGIYTNKVDRVCLKCKHKF